MLNLTVKADHYVTITTPKGETMNIIVCASRLQRKQIMLGFEGNASFNIARSKGKWSEREKNVHEQTRNESLPAG